MDTSLQQRARARAAVSRTGIGAAFERDVSPPDLDGLRVKLWVSDGNDVGPIEAQIAASEKIHGTTIPVLTLQRVVERRAGDFAIEARLSLLLAKRQLQLRTDDFHDRDFEPADSPLAAQACLAPRG